MDCGKCGGRAELFICPICTDTLRGQLGDIAWLADNLADAASGRERLARPAGKTSSAHDKLLFDPDAGSRMSRARDLYDETRTVLQRWVRDIAESRGVEFVPLGCRWADDPDADESLRIVHPGKATIGQMSTWLVYYIASIAQSEDAPLCAGEVEKVHGRAVHLINPPRARAYKGTCPAIVDEDRRGNPIACGVDLYADPDRPVVQCTRCKATHEVRHLEDRMLAEMGKFNMPQSQLLKVMRELGEPIGRSTWFAWTGQRRIQPRDYGPDGKPRFNLDEARALRKAGIEATTKASARCPLIH